jgi:hypothetical protein
MTAGTLTVTPGKIDKQLVQPMAGELRDFLASLPAGVGKVPLFPSLHGRITGRNGGLSNEFGRLMQRAEIVAPVGREKKGPWPAGAHEEFSQPAAHVRFVARERRRFRRRAKSTRWPRHRRSARALHALGVYEADGSARQAVGDWRLAMTAIADSSFIHPPVLKLAFLQ